MATSIQSTDKFHTNHNEHGSLRFILFDSEAIANIFLCGSERNTIMVTSNGVVKFQNQEECQQYIKQRSNYRLVLITSGSSGRNLVPKIHQLPQVTSIYVFCMDETSHKIWARNFSKVKAVTSHRQDLISRIKQDQNNWLIKPQNGRMKAEESLSYKTFTISKENGSSTTGINGQFIYFQLLMDCLLRLEANETDKEELIDYCKTKYQHDKPELDRIGQFQKTYVSGKALWWYTRNSFVYRDLNRALRHQEIHMLFLFRSFICDVCNRLKTLNNSQSKKKFRVYRTQLMSKDEIHTLQKSIDQFISINSFLSTSTQRETALFFLGEGQPANNLQKVLFEIDVDPERIHANSTTAFADINEFSVFKDEGEVLFMLGSIFRLKNVRLGQNQTWTIQMKLYSDDEHDLKEVLERMRQQNGKGPTNLRTLGKLLWVMGELHLAERYYCRLIKQLPFNDFWLCVLYDDLMRITSQKHEYDESLRWQEKLHQLKDKDFLKKNKEQNSSSTGVICPRCDHFDRVADPFRLPLGFRAVLYDHMPFYEDRKSYQTILHDATSFQKRMASRNVALADGHVYDAFLNGFPRLVKDVAHIYGVAAVSIYNRCRYDHAVSDIDIGRNSRFCFFLWKNIHQEWVVFVCCHEHL